VRSAKKLSGHLSDHLRIGKPNSLGKVPQVVRDVLRHPRKLGALFECIFHEDEWVRMRASDALEKVCAENPKLLTPLKRRIFEEMAEADQPSVQWHFAQIMSEMELSPADVRTAVRLIKRNLERTNDWIVVNLSLETLAIFARRDRRMLRALEPMLTRYARSPHKSVRHRVKKLRAELFR
jgi:hypothetical protein